MEPAEEDKIVTRTKSGAASRQWRLIALLAGVVFVIGACAAPADTPAPPAADTPAPPAADTPDPGTDTPDPGTDTPDPGAETPDPGADRGTLRIGGLTTLEGPFAVSGQDSFRGMEMALEEYNYRAGGYQLEWITESSDANPDVAVDRARKLIEQDGVHILIGPLSGSEGIAVKEFAKEHPNRTFLNGSSGAQDTTLRDPAENFYRFSTEGVQWMAGLGTYAYETLGYESVTVIAEDYSFPYAQVAGFLIEYCQAGGRIDDFFWVPLPTSDFSSVIAGLNPNTQAIMAVVGGSDAVNFLTQYDQAGGQAPIMGGSITLDQTVLSAEGPFEDLIIGAVSATPVADNWDDPGWQEFVSRYQERFPDGLGSPSLFAHAYYINTKAALEALEQLGEDLDEDQSNLREVLNNLTVDTPTGPVSVNENRQATADIFVVEIQRGEDGRLFQEVVDIAQGVDQFFGLPSDSWVFQQSPSRDHPDCDRLREEGG
jgi:branched-chain amino acid transport system substrate-binding protein